MHPFQSLFTEEPETEYVPDFMGRLGQGETVVKPDPEPIGTPDPRFDEFIKAERQGAGLTDLFGTDDPLGIKGPVGPVAPNRRADVGKVETFLSKTGNFDLNDTDGPTGYYGMRLEDAVNGFQEANGLKTDGLLNPGGKTIKALAGKLKGQIEPPTPKPAAPLTLPGQGAEQQFTPLKHKGGGTGGKHPEIAAAAPPTKDPLEAFKKADRESIRGLAASQKPKPTHREAERTSMRSFRTGEAKDIDRKIRVFLLEARAANLGSKAIRALGGGEDLPNVKIGNTIDAMQRFVDGIGGVKDYDPKWMLGHKVLDGAAKRIEGHFVNWLSGARIPNDPKERIIGRLLAIKPGHPITASTPFDARYKFDNVRDKTSDHRLLLGDGFIKASGAFTFARRGNMIEVTGSVENKISDPFDWTPGRVNKFEKYGIKREIRHDDMIKLQRYGKAKPFTVRSVWRRKITWRLKIVRDPNTGKNRLVGVGRPRWSDSK